MSLAISPREKTMNINRKCRVDASKPTHCSAHNMGLMTLNTREIYIHDDLAVAGSDDGLWYHPLLP
jgi:hypothetical protein